MGDKPSALTRDVKFSKTVDHEADAVVYTASDKDKRIGGADAETR